MLTKEIIAKVVEDINQIKIDVAVLVTKVDTISSSSADLKQFVVGCSQRHEGFVTQKDVEPLFGLYHTYRKWTWTVTLLVLGSAAVLALTHGLIMR